MVFLGKILKSRGNRGEVVVVPSPGIDFLGGRFSGGVLLKSQRYSLRKEIESICGINGQVVVKFKDSHTIEDALRLIGYAIYCDTNDSETVIEEGPGRLIGFEVRDDQGIVWGTVTAVLEQPLNPLLEVTGDPGGEPILIPFTPAIIYEIRVVEKVVLIHPPAGLKELNS